MGWIQAFQFMTRLWLFLFVCLFYFVLGGVGGINVNYLDVAQCIHLFKALFNPHSDQVSPDIDFKKFAYSSVWTEVTHRLDASFLLTPRQCLESEDDLQQLQSDGVPSEVTDWLASTFTQKVRRPARRSDEKPKFRSIVHAVQAGIFVERCVIPITPE